MPLFVQTVIDILSKFVALLRSIPPIDYLMSLQEKVTGDYIGLIAAGISFYFLLAAFPAIGALISLYGLVSDPHDITEQLSYFHRFLPGEAFNILNAQAEKVASSNEGILSLGIVIGLLVTIYSASKGVQALIKGLNIAFSLRERRNILALGFTGYVLTFAMMFYFLMSLSLVAGVPLVLKYFFFSEFLLQLFDTARWPVLFFAGIVGLEILYFFGPCHQEPRWRWVSWGSFIATMFWLCSSILFSTFVSQMGNYNETYGSLGAVIVLMLWFWISAGMIIFGAEVNAVLSAHRKKWAEKAALE